MSKDADFHHLSFLFGAPPKVVWLRIGNASTREVADVLKTYRSSIQAFSADPDAALLIVPGPDR